MHKLFKTFEATQSRREAYKHPVDAYNKGDIIEKIQEYLVEGEKTRKDIIGYIGVTPMVTVNVLKEYEDVLWEWRRDGKKIKIYSGMGEDEDEAI